MNGRLQGFGAGALLGLRRLGNAQAAIDAFGKAHVVCNNAGVGGTSDTDNFYLKDWRWVVDINLMGVVHGVKTFVH